MYFQLPESRHSPVRKTRNLYSASQRNSEKLRPKQELHAKRELHPKRSHKPLQKMVSCVYVMLVSLICFYILDIHANNDSSNMLLTDEGE